MAPSKVKNYIAGTAALAMMMSAVPASAVTIVLNPDNTFATAPNGAAALRDFQAAADFWNTSLSNNATINLNISFAALGAGIIGSTGSTRIDVSASDVYAALRSKGTSALDAAAVANLRPLSTAGGIGYRMPASSIPNPGDPQNGLGLNTTAGSIYDNDDTYNNQYLYANTANLKALGIGVINPEAADGKITFSSNFAFDFDPTDGIAVGTQDFISVAVHEIGHALGFVSGADFYDAYGRPNGPAAATGDLIDWDGESVLSVFDLFRYSTNPAANGGFGADGKRLLQLDPNRGAAFSYDALTPFNANNSSVAEFGNLSTGRYNGDGQQASHWKDATGYFDANGCFEGSRQIGIMDPTSGSCQLGIVTANDLAAFDAMGYNLNLDVLQNRDFTFNTAQIYAASVPEPTSWMMMIVGVILVGGIMRRRNKVSLSVHYG